MATIAPRTPLGAELPYWEMDVVQLLEEHHMVAWSPRSWVRAAFCARITEHLRMIDDTQVCVVHGYGVIDAGSFARQVALALGGESGRGLSGESLPDVLRRRYTRPGERPVKRRYYLWTDADLLLRRDHRCFGAVVDALAGVAAESEYASDDLLLLHRAIFVGGPALDVYAEDRRGQFCTWLREEDEEPFWRVVSGVENPPFIRYPIPSESLSSPEPALPRLLNN